MKSVSSTYFLRIYFYFSAGQKWKFLSPNNYNYPGSFFLAKMQSVMAITSAIAYCWSEFEGLLKLGSKFIWKGRKGLWGIYIMTKPSYPTYKKEQQIASLMKNSWVVRPEYQKRFIFGHSQQRNLSLKPEFYCFYQPITKGVHGVNIVLP